MNILKRYIDEFPKQRILCVGDAMLDIFVYGKAERLSPEAPVAVLKKSSEKKMLGGSGNVAVNLRSLGCTTLFAGIVGEDAEGELLRAFLTENGVDDALLLTVPECITTVKTRFLAGNQHLLRVDQERPLVLKDESITYLLEQLETQLNGVDIVLLSDYGKGIFDERLTPSLIECCRAHGKKIIVDPKRVDWTIYSGATLVKPNLKEFVGVVGKRFQPTEPGFVQDALSSAREVCARYHVENILVTLSEHGMIFLPADEARKPIWLPTEARDVFDVSGAGDTSLAVLGVSLAAGASVSEAMRLANAASGIVVGKTGTASVTRQELARKLQVDTPSVVIRTEEAVEVAAALRAQGKVVGFTNGCFDLLHPGHLQSFALAHELCDVLFVGLNTDASIRRLKGEGRPINDERTRAELLAALKSVDYVILFDEDTAMPLIDKLRPDVIAKEGYPLERWPEGQQVIAYGGRAVELPRLDGYSSTQIINKMTP